MFLIFSKITLGFLRLKGINIKQHVIVHRLVSISRGFSNHKKGRVNISSHCELSRGVVLKAYGGEINIGQNSFLGEYVVIYGHGGVEIGTNTLIAMHSCIVSSNHTVPDQNTLIRSQPDILLPVKIGNDVWIGAGAKILGGVEIGDGCVIGAGAVVTKSLTPYSIAYGNPAQVRGQRA
jgi:acetyltransferase-like isoleucine patch superfamily enzyme